MWLLSALEPHSAETGLKDMSIYSNGEQPASGSASCLQALVGQDKGGRLRAGGDGAGKGCRSLARVSPHRILKSDTR